MTFVASKVFWLVAEPAALLLLAFLAGMILRLFRYSRTGNTLLLLGAGAYTAIWLLPLGAWLVVPLENRFPQPQPPPAHVDGIVVLGGGIDPQLSTARGDVQLNGSGDRMTALVALARRYPTARVLFAGGVGTLTGLDEREADHAARFIREIAPELEPRIVFERDSRDTFENAVRARELLQPRPGETWLLVTSAWHMPRAIGVFRKAGWDVVAWPVDYLTDGTPSWSWRIGPGAGGGLPLLSVAMKEWLGLLAYRLLGRSDSAFPAP